jgi:membrane protein implicated in regulation of membrane protease activity
MDLWIAWVILAVAFGFGELHTNAFYLAPFAGGAAIAAVVAVGGGGLAVSTVIFLVASLASLGVLRPVALRHRRLPPSIRTGAAALVGQRGTVVERIVNDEGVGCVKIGGEVWTARSFDDGDVIEVGKRVEVVEIKGATALVME